MEKLVIAEKLRMQKLPTYIWQHARYEQNDKYYQSFNVAKYYGSCLILLNNDGQTDKRSEMSKKSF